MANEPPLLCATVTGDTMEALRLGRAEAERAGVDLVELRLDSLQERPDAVAALAGRTRPVIITCRPVWEGGGFRGTEADREVVLADALDAGAEYVDVEWKAPARAALIRRAPDRIVVSHHDFEGVPGDLESTFAGMLAAGAAVTKLAVTARRASDLVPLLSLRRLVRGNQRAVLIGMGDAGVASRLLPARFDSAWSYAGSGVAPGQVPVDRLLKEFRFRQVTRTTPIYGVVGRPVSHSLSPAIHNAAFDATSIDGVFVPFEAESIDDFESLATALEVAGVSITAPFKRDAFARARSVAPEARPLGAINTWRRRADGGWDGLNSDVDGFLAPLEHQCLDGARATIIGAGGAARAVASALASRQARITVRARRLEAAADVAAMVGGEAGDLRPPTGSWDLLINTTPVGTWPAIERSPLDDIAFDGRLVYDLVYNPPDTELMRRARAAGVATLGGLDMLVAQAARQFTWWTGRTAPVEAMRGAAEARLAASYPTQPAEARVR